MKSVAIIINVYNQARFLREAIESALSQSVRADEVFVVDDGSSDSPDSIVEEFPGVLYVRKENGGLSSSRNVGLHLARCDYIVFLDADDRLTPVAIEAGLNAFQRNPHAWIVYGAYRFINERGAATSPIWQSAVGENPTIQFLRGGNFIAMHATVMFDRVRLVELKGYDETLPCCEDYDLYLRVAQLGKIECHDAFTAEYRHHAENMSRNRRRMLETVQRVIRRHAIAIGSPASLDAAKEGMKRQKLDYAVPMVREAAGELMKRQFSTAAFSDLWTGFRTAKFMVLRAAVSSAARKFLSTDLGNALRKLLRLKVVPKGRFDFGDFNSIFPASRSFGFDRGKPVDRFYIENFLASNAALISGRVLEVGDRAYTRTFGGDRVTRSEVVHVDPNFADASYHGDLTVESVLPSATFDCIIVTQTLHLIFDMPAAVKNLRRALKPGGVLLITSPGLSPIDRADWASTWYWSITQYGLTQLLLTAFDPEEINVVQYGNAFSAMAFLQGLAVEELPLSKLDFSDPAMPVIVASSARRGAP